MIHRVFSSLSTFKDLEFTPGLNVLIAQKEAGATDKQTRNRAGKTSLIEIIHFLTGAKVEKDSPFRSERLESESFGLTFDLGEKRVTAERTGKEKSRVRVCGAFFLENEARLSNSEWMTFLGENMFDLRGIEDGDDRAPSFRSLFPYFVRRQLAGAFITPEKQAVQQQIGDLQLALLYLLGLDWRIAREWQKVRDREKTLKVLKKAAGAGALGDIIGKASELRTQVAVAEARLKEMTAELADFRVLAQYRELESEADQLTRQINDLSNADVIDAGSIRDLELAMASESPPPLDDLEKVYADAGISLPGFALKRYEEVKAFHESVVRNRRNYLAVELDATKHRVAGREREKRKLDERRSEVMGLLQAHGALDQFSRLQAETARKQAEVEVLGYFHIKIYRS